MNPNQGTLTSTHGIPQSWIDAALGSGIKFFDTADCYGAGQSEEFLGKALKRRRNRAIIVTKFGIKMGEGKEGARPEYVLEALDASLKRLQTDVINLYQIHRPDPGTRSPKRCTL